MSSNTNGRPFSRMILVWAGIVVIVAGMRASASLVVPFLISLFLAILCGPPLEWLMKRGLRRGLAMLLVLGGLCVVVLVMARVVVATANDFVDEWPKRYQPMAEKIADDWQSWIEARTKSWTQALNPEPVADEPGISEDSSADSESTNAEIPPDDPGALLEADKSTTAEGQAQTDSAGSGSIGMEESEALPSGRQWNEWIEPDFLMRAFTTGMRAVSGILSQALLILVTTIFLLVEATSLPAKLHTISDEAPRRLEKLQQIAQEVNQYMAIKTSTSLLTGGLITVALWLLGVDFALLWGMTAFLLNYVPNIGSIIAAVPAVLMTLLEFGMGTAALVVGLYVAVNMFIGYFLEPRWMGRGLGLSTLVVFISLVFWGWVLGPVGMVISVPLTMAVKIALEGSDETRWLAILMGSGG